MGQIYQAINYGHNRTLIKRKGREEVLPTPTLVGHFAVS